MHGQQDGKCAICERIFGENLKPCVDHCHRTGVVRALLCSECNKGIGLLQDDALVVERALRYLTNGYVPTDTE